MRQTRSDYFTFGFINCKDLGFRLVELGNADFKTSFGTDYNVKANELSNGANENIRHIGKTQNFTLTMCKVDGDSNPIDCTDEELDYILGWLKCGEVKVLEVDGRNCKGSFTKVGELNRKKGEFCFITITFSMATPWISRGIEGSGMVYVDKEYYLQLDSKANINRNNIPLVISVDMQTSTEISIENITTGVIMVLSGITNTLDKKFIIGDTDGYEIIDNVQDTSRDMGKYLQKPREFIYLRYGINDIKIKCDDMCIVSLAFEDTMQLNF